MRLHFDALVLMQRVWGSFALMAAVALALLAAGAGVSLAQAGSLGGAERGAVWLLATCAAVLGAGGAGARLVARGLHARRTPGRVLALAFAVPNLVVVPFGTALGVYTFWVLLNDDARREFGRPLRGPSSPGTAR
jgi:hypothetical protein